MTDSIRLAKRIASMLPCSRSEAEQYIENGFVTVDGLVVEAPGTRVLDEQRVELLPDAKLTPNEAVTILFHKPAGVDIEVDPEHLSKIITAENQLADDRSGIRFRKQQLKLLTLAEPLGLQSSGLVVLTQDWRVSRKLIQDSVKVEQEFIVETQGELIADGLALLNKDVIFKGKPIPIKVSWQSENKLRIAFKGIQRGQIVTMCSKVGLEVVSMKRIRIGRVPMSALSVGQWRYLLGYEQF